MCLGMVVGINICTLYRQLPHSRCVNWSRDGLEQSAWLVIGQLCFRTPRQASLFPWVTHFTLVA